MDMKLYLKKVSYLPLLFSVVTLWISSQLQDRQFKYMMYLCNRYRLQLKLLFELIILLGPFTSFPSFFIYIFNTFSTYSGLIIYLHHMFCNFIYYTFSIMYLVNITKQQCDTYFPKCTSCDLNYTSCLGCPSYYELVSGQCQNCLANNCPDCASSLTICLYCQTNFYLDSGQCQPCNQPNCIQYRPNTNQCIYCDNGYGIVPSNYTCQSCGSYCQSCTHNYSQCTNCISAGFQLKLGVCSPCTAIDCETCNTNLSKCDSCKKGAGWKPNSTLCILCTDTNCIKCSSLATKCDQCREEYGVNSSYKCQKCSNMCKICSTSVSICNQCFTNYGIKYNGIFLNISTNICQPCSSKPECLQCDPTNSSICFNCNNKYANVNGTCKSCSDTKCKNCSLDVLICYECDTPYGLNGTICKTCAHPCKNCPPFNYQQCTSCVNGYLLLGSFCGECVGNCTKCTNFTECQICDPNYYLNLDNGQCEDFPPYCTSVVYNTIQHWPDCLTCKKLFNLTKSNQKRCDEICGDGVAIFVPCDNGLNISYDGCSNQCKVEPGFVCQKNASNISTCSYIQQLEMNIVSCKRDPLTNSITLKVSIFPPLHVFSISDVSLVFQLRNDIFKVKSVSWNAKTSELTFKADFYANFLDEPLVIDFLPTNSVALHFYASVNSSTSMKLTLDHYDEFAFKTGTIIPYLCYAIVIIGWICYALGFLIKRLAGLQAMIVLHIAFLSLLWLDSKLYLPFLLASPLKYALGYSLNLISANNQNINGSSLVPGNSYTPFSQMSMNYPHTLPFAIDQLMLANNFNIFFCLQILPLPVILFLIAIIKYYEQQAKNMVLEGEEQMGENQQDVSQANTPLAKAKRCICILEEMKNICYLWFMYFSIFNLLNFVSSAILFFKLNVRALFRNISSNIPNLIIFIASILLYTFLYIKFWRDPDPFSYFRYSFKRKKPAIYQYCIFPIIIIVGIFFLTFSPQISFLPIIPFALFLIYNFIFQPYRETRESCRFIFNLIVIICILAFRVYLQYLKQYKNSTKTYLWHFLNLVLLLIVVLVALASLIYQIIYQYYIQPKIEKNEKEKVMYELDLLNVRKKMREIQIKDTAFHLIITPKMNILNFSNQIQQECYSNARDNTVDEIYKQPLSPQKDEVLNQTNATNLVVNKKKFKLDKKSLASIKQRASEFLETKKKDYYPEIAKMNKEELQEFNKKMFALEVAADENKYIRLKNAQNYTNIKMKLAQWKHNPDFVQSYYNIADKLQQ